MAAPFSLLSARGAGRAANSLFSKHATFNTYRPVSRLTPLTSSRHIASNNNLQPPMPRTNSPETKAGHDQRSLHRHGRENWPPEEKANNPEAGNKRFADFELQGRVYVVTGGARGLGPLALTDRPGAGGAVVLAAVVRAVVARAPVGLGVAVGEAGVTRVPGPLAVAHDVGVVGVVGEGVPVGAVPLAGRQNLHGEWVSLG